VNRGRYIACIGKGGDVLDQRAQVWSVIDERAMVVRPTDNDGVLSPRNGLRVRDQGATWRFGDMA
jgi:hypothetical protein